MVDHGLQHIRMSTYPEYSLDREIGKEEREKKDENCPRFSLLIPPIVDLNHLSKVGFVYMLTVISRRPPPHN